MNSLKLWRHLWLIKKCVDFFCFFNISLIRFLIFFIIDKSRMKILYVPKVNDSKMFCILFYLMFLHLACFSACQIAIWLWKIDWAMIYTQKLLKDIVCLIWLMLLLSIQFVNWNVSFTHRVIFFPGEEF